MPNAKFTFPLCGKEHQKKCTGVGTAWLGNEKVVVFCSCKCHKKESEKLLRKAKKLLATQVKWQAASEKKKFLITGETH